MTIEVDLHLHTSASDGTLTPTELVELCAGRGLKTIAISDHDSTEGLTEAFAAADAFTDLRIIPAIELSTDVPGSEIHVLGYFINTSDKEFQETLARFREGRFDRGSAMVKRLNSMGYAIEWSRVQQIAGDASIGRPHIASAMVEAGYYEYPNQVFDELIGREGPAYVERMKLTPEDAILMLRQNGAVPVMAHPTYSQIKSSRGEVQELDDTVRQLKEHGLVGVEVFYGDYTPDQVANLERIANELDLIPCGGSDYHCSGNPGEPEPGTVGPPMATVERLEAAHRDIVRSVHRV
ncbi:MAG: PHP domain-containing protein [Dehalococcoidia bacterium]|nr:PHP domain-containing protein [Dehalococcoidia bacterium]